MEFWAKKFSLKNFQGQGIVGRTPTNIPLCKIHIIYKPYIVGIDGFFSSPRISKEHNKQHRYTLLRKGTRYDGHPARMRSRIGARRAFILKIASERKETGHMKMLNWGLNFLIILMYLKFRQGFCKNRLVWANPDGSSHPRIVRRGFSP